MAAMGRGSRGQLPLITCGRSAHVDRMRGRDQKEDMETVRHAFGILDLDNSGSIEADELRKVLEGFSRAGEVTVAGASIELDHTPEPTPSFL